MNVARKNQNKSTKFVNKFTHVEEKESIATCQNDKFVKLPWVPIPGPELKSKFKKLGIKTTFACERNLKNLIYKSKLLPNIFPGFNELDLQLTPFTLMKLKMNMIFTGTIENNRKILTKNGKSHIKRDFNLNAMNSSTDELKSVA